MRRFTIIPQSTFEEMQVEAGILLKNFNPANPTFEDSDIICATTGGITVSCKATYVDYGEDVDNCPNNTKELKQLDYWDCSISTTGLGTSPASIRMGLGAADIDSEDATKIVPRRDLAQDDFEDAIWWVGDRADGGFVAVKLKNALSTDGFSLKTSKKGKGNVTLTITGHVSINAQDVVPMEFYSIDGTGGVSASITLNKRSITLVEDGTFELVATTVPDDATVTWTSMDTNVATVSDGTVTAEGAGTTVIIASIIEEAHSYICTCNVTVTEASSDGEG